MRRHTTRKYLAEKYGVHPETITKWLRDAGIADRTKKALTAEQVRVFIEKVGTPEMLRKAFEDLNR